MKKKLLVVSLLCTFVIVFAMVAVGCGSSSVSRGGGGGQNVANAAEWTQIVTNSNMQANSHERNWTWTQETRGQSRADSNNRVNTHTVQRTIRNGNRIQQGNIFFEFNEEESTGTLRRYTRIEMDAHGVFRDIGTVGTTGWNAIPRPLLVIQTASSLMGEFGLDNFDFTGGRLVLNVNRWVEELREEHYYEATDEWKAENPFVSPLARRDRLRVEITVINGLISNVFTSGRNHAANATTETRMTIDWDSTSTIRIPTVVDGDFIEGF